jgi:hypothetical protein
MRSRTPLLTSARIWCNVELENAGYDTPCWAWQRGYDKDGYGLIWFGKAGRRAHRAAYEEFVGPIPEGLSIDHLCRNRGCCNPAHLEPVTHAENMARSGPAQITHCANGHEYTPENTYTRPTGQRDCRACIRDRARRYKERKAAA